MKRKRKQYSGALKARVALEAMMGVKTVAQLGREYQVHPLLVSQWKATLRERLPELFERGQPVAGESEEQMQALKAKVGELTMHVDWLKKKCRQLGLPVNDGP
jgi:transposase-like protein